MDAERRSDKYRLFMSNGEAYVHADEAEAFRTTLKAMGREWTEKRVMNHVKFIRGTLK